MMRVEGRPVHVFVTGASGLIGGATLRGLLTADPTLTASVLVRDVERWHARWNAPMPARLRVLQGDIERPGLGLDSAAQTWLQRSATHVVHAAANTRFSQTTESARRTNVTGTRHVLELFDDTPLRRFVQVSSAFAVGTLEGRILEQAYPAVPGWVNAYEQSKYEAEALVRSSGQRFLIARSSTVVCDDDSGRISQLNAVHQALRLFHGGLAAMLPGGEDSPVDLVTTRFVASALVTLTLNPIPRDNSDPTVHLCAGDGALRLGDLLDRSRGVWSQSSRWRARMIERPTLTDLATYRLFERSVEETGDARIRAITRGLSTFVPQLAHPKSFDTIRADSILGRQAPPVSDYWDAVCRSVAAMDGRVRPRKAS